MKKQVFRGGPLAPATIAQLVARAEIQAMALVDFCQSTAWTVETWTDEVMTLRREIESGSTTSGCFMTSMQVLGTINEVMELYNATPKVGSEVVDSIRLQTIEPNRVYLTWQSHDGSFGYMKRDACLLECLHTFTTLSGRSGYVRSLKSIELSWCPNLEQGFGYVRMENFGSGVVCIESERPGYIELSCVTHADVRMGSSEWLTSRLLGGHRQLVSTMLKHQNRHQATQIDAALRERRLRKSSFLSAGQLVDKSMKFECFLCQKRFRRWHRVKVNCFKCGEVFCGRCCLLHPAPIGHTDKHAIRVCTKCTAGVMPDECSRWCDEKSRSSPCEIPASERSTFEEENSFFHDSSRPTITIPMSSRPVTRSISSSQNDSIVLLAETKLDALASFELELSASPKDPNLSFSSQVRPSLINY